MQKIFVGLGMQAPHPREFSSLLDKAYGAARTARLLQQHADVHPFIANKVGHITQNPIAQHIRRFAASRRGVGSLAASRCFCHCWTPYLSDRAASMGGRRNSNERKTVNTNRTLPSSATKPKPSRLHPQPYRQFGNGCADDFHADTISSRTSLRRRSSCSNIFSIASASLSYHSGGISP